RAASGLGIDVRVDVGIVGDLRSVLEALVPQVPSKRHEARRVRIRGGQDETRARDIIHQPDNGKLYAAHVIHDLWKATEGAAVVVTDVGQHQMWEAQYYRHAKPRTLITSGGL